MRQVTAAELNDQSPLQQVEGQSLLEMLDFFRLAMTAFMPKAVTAADFLALPFIICDTDSANCCSKLRLFKTAFTGSLAFSLDD